LTVNNTDTLFLFTVNNNSKNNEIQHLTTKMVILKKSLITDLNNISRTAAYMKIERLHIISIVMDEKFEYQITEVNSPVKIVYIEIGFNYFLENFLGNPDNHQFWDYNRDSLYIFRDGDYSDIKTMFSYIVDKQVKMVRGSSQKSHIVSPIDFRLSSYLMILYDLDCRKINSNNAFNILTKDRYLPSG
jgi:hypothetical protein